MGFVAAPVNGIVLDVGEFQNIVDAGCNGGIDLANDRGLIRRLSCGRCNLPMRIRSKTATIARIVCKPPAIHGLAHALTSD